MEKRGRLLNEIAKRNLSKIDKRKYYGVKTNIDDYRKLIFNTFYDEKFISEAIDEFMKDEGKEDLHTTLDKISTVLSQRVEKIFTQVAQILYDAFVKGTARVQKADGSIIRFGEVKDKTAIQNLLKDQDRYFKNLTIDQSKKILTIIAKGKAAGQGAEAIANTIQAEVKDLAKTRAMVIARSEIIKAHNIGQIQVMKDLDVKHYHFITAQDKKVCKICLRYQGPASKPITYNVELAGTQSNPIPVKNTHPNCRCTLIIT